MAISDAVAIAIRHRNRSIPASSRGRAMRLAAAPAQQETEDEAETKGDKRRDERPLLDLVAHALRLPGHFGPSGLRRTARFLPGVGEAMSGVYLDLY